MEIVKVTVYVMPKKSVLDPQGAAVQHAMHSLGCTQASQVRVGKIITFTLAAEDTPAVRTQVDQLCQDLLSNPVIEDYRFDLQ